jgi:hypothetical protein
MLAVTNSQTSPAVITGVKTKQSVDTKLLTATPTLAATHNLNLVPANNKTRIVIDV